MNDKRILPMLILFDDRATTFLKGAYNDDFIRLAYNYYSVYEEDAEKILAEIIEQLEIEVKLGMVNRNNFDLDNYIFREGKSRLWKYKAEQMKRNNVVNQLKPLN